MTTKIDKNIERYFQLTKELKTIEEDLLQTVIKTDTGKLFHNFKILSDTRVEFKDVRTGATYGITPPAVAMHLERNWTEI